MTSIVTIQGPLHYWLKIKVSAGNKEQIDLNQTKVILHVEPIAINLVGKPINDVPLFLLDKTQL